MNELAPIGISTYSRLNHLTQTIEALKKNTLANESELYIFSDAPKKGDEEIVSKVRKYVHSIVGFKKIYIVERVTNGRVSNNRGGIKYLLDKYGKCIFMEDDIVTVSGFLQFMNDALDYYEKDDKVVSITGYCPPIKIPTDYEKDYFYLQRFNGWGGGLWKEKYDKIDKYLDKKSVLNNLENLNFMKELCINGLDIPQMLMAEIEGKIDALDVKIMYQQILYNWYTLHPIKSLVQNIGHDGTGVHCVESHKFHHDLLWDKVDDFKFEKKIELNSIILKNNSQFRFGMYSCSLSVISIYIKDYLNKKDIKSFSVYGLSKTSEEISNLLLKNFKINHFVDSFAEEKTIFCCNKKAISPAHAVAKNENIFLILSWNNKDILKNTLDSLDTDLIIITFDEIIDNIFKD